MSILSWLSNLYSSAPPINTVEGVYWWAQIVTLLFILATVISGAVTVSSGIIASKRQSDRELALKHDLLVAAQRLEAEKRTRLEMEDAIGPRLLEQQRSSEALKAFAGTKVTLECISDFDARRTAGQLAVVFQMAGWKLDGPWLAEPEDESKFFDGIIVQMGVGADIPRPAAESIIMQLSASKIFARMEQLDRLPTDVVVVKVGLRPIPYFVNKRYVETLPDKLNVFGNRIEPRRRPKTP
jgi:hypothetical protein